MSKQVKRSVEISKRCWVKKILRLNPVIADLQILFSLLKNSHRFAIEQQRDKICCYLKDVFWQHFDAITVNLDSNRAKNTRLNKRDIEELCALINDLPFVTAAEIHEALCSKE